MSDKLTLEDQKRIADSSIHSLIKKAFTRLEAYSRMVKNRRIAIALTKLEECLMWLESDKNVTSK